MKISELEVIRDLYCSLIADILLGKLNTVMKKNLEVALKSLNNDIDLMQVEKDETDYVTIYLAYELYRLKAEYFSEHVL